MAVHLTLDSVSVRRCESADLSPGRCRAGYREMETTRCAFRLALADYLILRADDDKAINCQYHTTIKLK